MRLNSISIELDQDDFIWHPYIFTGKYDNYEQAQYYGHEWFVVVYLWFWSVEMFRITDYN